MMDAQGIFWARHGCEKNPPKVKEVAPCSKKRKAEAVRFVEDLEITEERGICICTRKEVSGSHHNLSSFFFFGPSRPAWSWRGVLS